MTADPRDLHEHGEALAAADERLNRALRATRGDELAAHDLLQQEEARARAGVEPPDR